MNTDNKDSWSFLSYKEKNNLLFYRQKQILEMFLERGAISKEQYDKSLSDLIEKMGSAIVETSAKQHIRPGGKACCSASNGMTPFS